MSEPDYSNYSMDDLLDCEARIDADKWPKRHKLIKAEIERRTLSTEQTATDDKAVFFADFCHQLSQELIWSISDELFAWSSIFSKKQRHQLPSVIAEETCPICSSQLTGRKALWGWIVECKSCQLEGRVIELSVWLSMTNMRR